MTIYPRYTNTVLRSMGYQVDTDFVISSSADGIVFDQWTSTDPQPTVDAIEAARPAQANADLADRITTERNRRSDLIVAGSTDRDHVARSQVNILMAATGMLNAARQRPLTAEEEVLAATLAAIPAIVESLDAAADALFDWAVANLTGPAGLDTLDVASPPPEAPQWPV